MNGLYLPRTVLLAALIGLVTLIGGPVVAVAQDQSSDVDTTTAVDATSKADVPDIKPDDVEETDNPSPTDEAPEPIEKNRSAVIIPLLEDINPLSGALLKRKFAEAVDSGVDVIIFDIHSPGGFTYVTFELMDMILDAKDVETVAFIEKDAISGAALVSMACDKIIMYPDARIGDAGEIVMGADGAYRYTEAKSRSVLAQKVRDTAEATGRPLALAEKMTDRNMVVFSATHKTNRKVRYFSNKEWESFKESDDWEKGKPVREASKDMFFTANGRRATELGMADLTVENRQELADVLGIKTPPAIPVMERTWVDTLVFILNSGFVTFLLLVIGMVALVIELGAPGLGIGGLTSLLCFGLFFWSRFLGGTAGWLEVTLFAVGLSFIAAEMFVIPGFGVAGISGIVLTLGSLVMASRRFLIPGEGEDFTGLGIDVLTVIGAFAGFIVAILFLANYIGEIPGLSRLTLKPQVAVEDGPPIDRSNPNSTLPGWQVINVGDLGTTVSPLRPSGKMQFGEMMVDVVTEGDFVEAACDVKVIGKQGARVIVRQV